MNENLRLLKLRHQPIEITDEDISLMARTIGAPLPSGYLEDMMRRIDAFEQEQAIIKQQDAIMKEILACYKYEDWYGYRYVLMRALIRKEKKANKFRRMASSRRRR